MTVVMVMGEIDLSVGSIVGLAAAMLGALVTHGVPFGVAVVIALAPAWLRRHQRSALYQVRASVVRRHARDLRALPGYRRAHHRRQQRVELSDLVPRMEHRLCVRANHVPADFWSVRPGRDRRTAPAAVREARQLHRLQSSGRALRGDSRQPGQTPHFRGLGPDVGGRVTDPGVSTAVPRQHRRHRLRTHRDHGRSPRRNRLTRAVAARSSGRRWRCCSSVSSRTGSSCSASRRR